MKYGIFKDYIMDKAEAGNFEVIADNECMDVGISSESTDMRESDAGGSPETLVFVARAKNGYSNAVKTFLQVDLVELYKDLQYEKDGAAFNKIDALFAAVEDAGCKLCAQAYIDSLNETERKRYNALRELRAKIADEEEIRLYMVFDNRTLAELSRIKPVEEEAMRTAYGVGDVKMKKYGSRFLELLRVLE